MGDFLCLGMAARALRVLRMRFYGGIFLHHAGAFVAFRIRTKSDKGTLKKQIEQMGICKKINKDKYSGRRRGRTNYTRK